MMENQGKAFAWNGLSCKGRKVWITLVSLAWRFCLWFILYARVSFLAAAKACGVPSGFSTGEVQVQFSGMYST
jgi:hypothetical protein